MKSKNISEGTRRGFILTLLIICIICHGCKVNENDDIRIPELDKYSELVWEENFKGNKLDSTKWTPLHSHYWKHEEKQIYVSDSEHINIEDSLLLIKCFEKNDANSGDLIYTSACVSTKNKISLESCRIDIRAKMPFGKGIISGIALRPDNETNPDNMGNTIEIAVLDGSNPNKIMSKIRYYDQYNIGRGIGDWYYTEEEKDFARGFHTYSLIQDYGKIWFYVDDKLIFNVSENNISLDRFPFHEKFHLIFNIAVGGKWAGEPDSLITAFPQKMEVDYVRIFKNPSLEKVKHNHQDFPDLQTYSKLTWSDEFDEEHISDKNWTHETGDFWWNDEIQAYTSDSTNSYISNGHLVINAMKTPDHIETIRNYTSARLITKDKVTFGYGRIDFRIKVGAGKGIWPAAWLLPNDDKFGPWPTSGEIDVLEIFGADSLTQHMTAHFGKNRSDHRSRGGKIFRKEGFNDGFHIYSLVREKDHIWWYFNGEPCFQISKELCYPHHYPFNEEFYAILNLAIGGGTAGYPDENTVFPSKMWVDYVRFYEN